MCLTVTSQLEQLLTVVPGVRPLDGDHAPAEQRLSLCSAKVPSNTVHTATAFK